MAQTTALIAADGMHDAIEEILDAHGLQATTFDRVEDVPSATATEVPSVAVLCVEDASPSPLLRLLRLLTERLEEAPTVVICSEIGRSGIRVALTNGATGIVLQEDIASALGPCLQAVLAGQTCVPTAHSREIEPPALSSREKQILGLVVMSYTNSQIAEQLFLAESTVKSHLSSAFAKLGVRSRNEAVSLILDPKRGLGMGILALVGDEEAREPAPAVAR